MKTNLNDMRTKAGHNLPELSTAPVVLPSPGRKKYLDVSDLYLHLVWKLTKEMFTRWEDDSVAVAAIDAASEKLKEI